MGMGRRRRERGREGYGQKLRYDSSRDRIGKRARAEGWREEENDNS
jgi:hypothetical protein